MARKTRWYASGIAQKRFMKEGLTVVNPKTGIKTGYTGKAKKMRGLWFFEYKR
jgi:hypothetical protein